MGHEREERKEELDDAQGASDSISAGDLAEDAAEDGAEETETDGAADAAEDAVDNATEAVEKTDETAQNVSDASAGARSPWSRWVWTGAWLTTAVVALWHVLYYFPRTVDDMFIYLRYAENVAAGHGLVYNLGEPVEGYSGPLWMLLLIVGELVGVGGVTWTKVLGVGSLVALGAGTYRLGRERFDLRPALAWLPVLALALNSYVISWALWGLETPAYLALMMWTAVWMQRHGEQPSRRSFAALALTAGGLLLSRPEAPLFAGVLGVAEVWRAGQDGGVRNESKLSESKGQGPWPRRFARLRLLLPPSLTATGMLAAYMLFRRAYFGLWLPHTHYAKEGEGFTLSHLGPFVVQGSSVWEIAAFALMVLFGLRLLWRRKDPMPLLVALAVAFFVGLVERDWMPNVRHFLPLQVILPVALLGGAAAFSGTLRRVALSVGVGVLVVSSLDIATIDSRFSVNDFHTHGRGENWRKEKTAAVWTDTWACLQGEWPEHVRQMGPYNQGMITQLYALLEADARPLNDVWFIARDIGRVGWLSPARIFDTDGLFTPDVVELGAETVSDEVLRRAFARPVAMSELYGPWARAYRLPEVRAAYEPSPDVGHLGARDQTAPSPEVVRTRYEAALAKMPAYTMMTLYGEGVGAALARRTAFVQARAEDLAPMEEGDLPEGLGPHVRFDDSIELLGCTHPPSARRSETVSFTCYYRALETPHRDYTIFAHMLGGPFINADHAPVGGFLPTGDWAPGRIVRDRFEVHVPEDYGAPVMVPRIGLYVGNHRAEAVGEDGSVDDEGRVVLSDVQIAQ